MNGDSQNRSTLPHYYGDYVRRLFIGIAGFFLIALPFWGAILLPFGPFFAVGAALILVLLAGLTSPRNRQIFLWNTIASGLGVLLVEGYAIAYYAADSIPLFLFREITAVAFLFAFYFSVKTMRAMALHQIGVSE